MQDTSSSRFKFTPRQTRLSYNRLKCSNSDLIMVRNGDRYRPLRKFLLHNNVAAAPAAYLYKAVSCQYSAHFFAGQHTKLTQQARQLGLRTLRHEDVV
jgi:hypothetical protein